MSNTHRAPNASIALILMGILTTLPYMASSSGIFQETPAAVLELNDNTDEFYFEPTVEVFADENKTSTFQTLPNVEAAAWLSMPIHSFLRLKAEARYWIRIRLKNNGNKVWFFILKLSSQKIKKARLFTVTPSGADSSRLSGQSVPIHQRTVALSDIMFPAQLGPRSHTDCYLMLETGLLDLQTDLDILLENHPLFLPALGKIAIDRGLLSGFMAAFCIVALGIVLFFPQITHVLYFTYILGATLFVAADRGIGADLLWPQWPQFYGVAADLFLFICMSSFTYLVYYLLRAEHSHAGIVWLPRICALAGAIFVSIEAGKSGVSSSVYGMSAGLFGLSLALSVLSFLGLAIFQFLKHKNKNAGYIALIFLPLLITSIVLLVAEAGLVQKNDFINAHLLKMSIFAEFSIVSIVVIRNQYLTTLTFQLEAQQNKLLRMQEMERIAADLHDEVGSTLSSISILSTFGGGELQAEKIKSRLARINNQTLEVLEIMNDIIWSIKPSHEDTSHIIERMKAFLTNILQDHNISMSWQVNDSLNTLNLHPEQKKNMYLIFKESVNNMLKYAQASEITVSIDWTDGEVVMKICDNGRGFNLHESGKTGNGLGNMKMRAQNINGALRIESRASGGTTVQLSFPLVP